MKHILASLFALLVSVNAFGQADYLSPNGMTEVMSGVDDDTAHISLGHAFPYFGGTFTDAWMSSNGFILLYDPVAQFGNSNTGQSWCDTCPWGYSGGPPQGRSNLSFMIAPLWTDLRDANATPDAGYYYETNSDESKFLWYNVNEYDTQNTNTFQVNLWPDGSFDFIYDEVDITSHSTWIGFTGDTSNPAEVNELQYAQGSIDEFGLSFISQTFSGGRAWYGQDGGYAAGPDCSDALNDSSCPGYEEAYYSQQCNNDPFYDNQCPGYEQAYFDQQCSYDDLYDQMCPGYDNAIIVQNAAGTDFIFGDDISDFYDTEPMIDETDMFLAAADNIGMFAEEDIYGFDEDFGYDNAGVYEEFTEDFGAMGEPADPFLNEPVTEDFVEESYVEPTVEYVEEVIVEEDIFVEEEMHTESEGLDPQEEQQEIVEESVLEEEVIFNVEEELPIEINEPTVGAEASEASNVPSVNAVAIALSEVSLVETTATTLVATNNSALNNSKPFSQMQSNDSRGEEEVQNYTEVENTAENNYTDNDQQEQHSLPENGLVEIDSSNIVQQDLSFIDAGIADSIYSNIVLQEEDNNTDIYTIDFLSSIDQQDSAAGSVALDNSYSSVVQYEQEDFGSFSVMDFSANQFDATVENIQTDIVNPTMDFVQSNISLAIEQSSNLVSPNEQVESSANNESQQMDSSFGTVDATFDMATFNMMVDPIMLASDIEAFVAESPLEQAAQEEEPAVNFQTESSTPQQDAGFAGQQNQSFSTGQSITAVLNNVQPNYSQFNVAPPSQEEQQTTDKAEAQASNMTEEQLESNLDEFTNNMQDSGGFTDQSLTVFLMGRVNGFDQYRGQLQDVEFYSDRGMPGGRVQNDRNSMLRMMGTDNKHEELVSLQYGR